MDVFMLIPENPSVAWKGWVTTYYTHDRELFQKKNDQWYGIYKAVNSFQATKEEIEDSEWSTARQIPFLKKLNYIYADIDFAKNGDGKTQEEINEKKDMFTMELLLHCPPTVIIDTRNGIQPLWKLDTNDTSEEAQEKFVNVVNGVISWSKKHGAFWDEVKDVTRVLRVPWYNHVKWDPYPITHKAYHEWVYTLDDLQKIFPYEKSPVQKKEKTLFDNSWESLQMLEVERLDIEDVVIRAYRSRWQSASIDNKWRIVIDWYWVTWNFIGKKWDRQYIWSTSHDDISWNKVTSVAKMLDMSYSDAWRWIISEFNIPSEIELRKKNIKKIVKKEDKSWPETFSQMWGKKFSTGNRIIDADIWCFRTNDLVLFHWPSKNGKTYLSMSMANSNGMPHSMWGMWNKVAFFSLEMDTKRLKTQQASIRSWMSRLQFENENFQEWQWEEYCKHFEWFDDYFTIFDENDLATEEWITLQNVTTQIKKLHNEDWYDMFIIDSLKLIWWQNMKANAWEWKVIKELRKLKNELPICIVLIHHNSKWGTTFSGSQDLENFCDWRIEIRKEVDPFANGKTIFNQSIIRVHKERFGREIEYRFNFVDGKLMFESSQWMEEAHKDDEQKARVQKKPRPWSGEQWRDKL